MKPDDHWSVTVERNGEKVVTIESNYLCGRDLCPDDEATIKMAAEQLLSFLGLPYVLQDTNKMAHIVYPTEPF